MGRWPARLGEGESCGGVQCFRLVLLVCGAGGSRVRALYGCAGFDVFFSPLGDSLFFAPAKKSKQKKAGPCVAPLRGTLRCSWPGGRARTRRPIGASNRRALPYPPSTALLGAYEGEGKSTALRLVGCADIARAKRAPAVASVFAAGEDRRAVDGPVPFVAPRSGGLRGYGSRRMSEAPIGRRVRRRPPETEHRRFTPVGGATQGCAFFCLLFFAQAKKSKSPRGERKLAPTADSAERERANHTPENQRKHTKFHRGPTNAPRLPPGNFRRQRRHIRQRS